MSRIAGNGFPFFPLNFSTSFPRFLHSRRFHFRSLFYNVTQHSPGQPQERRLFHTPFLFCAIHTSLIGSVTGREPWISRSPPPPPASVRGLFKSQQKNFIIQVVGKDKAEESTQHASVIVQSKINVTVSSKCENFFVLDSLRV